MGGGGGGAVGMRLNIMTALYLPVLGYAMSTFDLNPDALVISSSNLEAYAVSENNFLSVGEEFRASIMYELKPTEAQEIAANAAVEGEGKKKDTHAKGVFTPDVVIDQQSSPAGMVYDTLAKQIVFDTQSVFDGEPQDVRTKVVTFRAKIIGKSAAGLDYYREIENQFEVFKPYVDVQSNAAPRLLAGCENSLKFSVPGIDVNSLVLNDKSSGLTVNGGTITWSPKGDTTTISISRRIGDQTKFVDVKGFKVTPPPPPSVFVRSASDRSKILTPQDVVTLLDDFELVVKPDPNFLTEFPKDSKYSVGKIRISISRAGLAPQEGEVSGNTLKLDSRGTARGEYIFAFNLIDALGGQVPRGQGVSFIIEDLSRINFQNARFKVDPTSVPSQFAFRAQ